MGTKMQSDGWNKAQCSTAHADDHSLLLAEELENLKASQHKEMIKELEMIVTLI